MLSFTSQEPFSPSTSLFELCFFDYSRITPDSCLSRLMHLRSSRLNIPLRSFQILDKDKSPVGENIFFVWANSNQTRFDGSIWFICNKHIVYCLMDDTHLLARQPLNLHVMRRQFGRRSKKHESISVFSSRLNLGFSCFVSLHL